MSDWNLWKSIESSLRLQLILLVSPFYCDHRTGALKTGWKVKFYMILATLADVTVTYYGLFHWNFLEVVFQIIPNQFVWKILSAYIVISTAIYFVFNAMIIFVQNSKQMDFLERIHTIDQKFSNEFRAAVDHKNYKRNLTIAMGVFYAYCIMMITVQLSILNFVNGLNTTTVLATLSVFFQLITMEAQIYTSANYLFLIERRYRLIFSIYKNVHRAYNQYRSHHGFVVRKIEKKFASKLLNLFESFREISDLTKKFDEIFGWVFASQVIKTFMLISFEMYVLFGVANNESMDKDQNYIVYGFMCMACGEMIKMFVNAIAIHSVYAAVNFFSQTNVI